MSDSSTNNTLNTPIPEQPIDSLVKQNPFNVNYIKSQARKALKEFKIGLNKNKKFEEIIKEYKAEQAKLKVIIENQMANFVNLKDNDSLRQTLDTTVEKVFDQCAQEEILDSELLQKEVYEGFDYHIDFEMIELFKRVRSNRENKSDEYSIIPPGITIGRLTSEFEYGNNIKTFVVTANGMKNAKVLGVVSRRVLEGENINQPIIESSKFVPISEPLSVETVHGIMFQNKLDYYPLLDGDNNFVDVISLQEMELIIKKRTKQSMQALDTSRQLHELPNLLNEKEKKNTKMEEPEATKKI